MISTPPPTTTLTLTLTLSTLLLPPTLALATPDRNQNINPHNNEETIPKRAPALNYIGCYSTSETFTNRTSHLYQSFGWCLTECGNHNAATFALQGYECLCGNGLPPSENRVVKQKCQTICPGFAEDVCGGEGLFSVYSTGLPGKDGVAVDANSASTSTSTSTATSKATSKATAAATSSAETHPSNNDNTPASDHSTEDAEDIQKSNSSNSGNTALIVGVVVGACGGAALVIGAFFLWRWRSRKRNAQENGVDYADGSGDFGHEASRVNSRFDGDYLAECRKINGSIDDFHDYSRRILKVSMHRWLCFYLFGQSVNNLVRSLILIDDPRTATRFLTLELW
ncbi:uncharacterized protein N7511_009227 [Penicillium nucicola]|uniref:uncharacterized protein n=1 Tax=Penicillium nucicola TaxID=1850975 RepID=UPI002545B544|nr:uncharacterized protein N7511_009227 [Penicillium nucicola]KAJ5747531.1 hypothetical protein N7511_009227 [Penicillium nucicola]